MKSILILTALIGANAFAKTTYNPESQKALVLSLDDKENVVAHVCEKVTEDEVRKPSDETLNTKCTRLAPIEIAAVSRNLEKFKKLGREQLADQKELFREFFDSIPLDKEEHRDEFTQKMQSMAAKPFDWLDQKVESLTPEAYMDILKLEARTPGLVVEPKASDLEDEIESLVALTSP